MDHPATLHFFCGKAGAGKSTLAAQLRHEHGAILVAEDVCMSRLFGEEMKTFDDYIKYSKRLKAVIGPLTIDLLRSGQTVVLDFQANTRRGRAWFRSLFETAQVQHVLHFVDTPDALCLARIAERNAVRPEGSHLLTEADFAYVSSFFEAPADDEGFRVTRYSAPLEAL